MVTREEEREREMSKEYSNFSIQYHFPILLQNPEYIFFLSCFRNFYWNQQKKKLSGLKSKTPKHKNLSFFFFLLLDHVSFEFLWWNFSLASFVLCLFVLFLGISLHHFHLLHPFIILFFSTFQALSLSFSFPSSSFSSFFAFILFENHSHICLIACVCLEPCWCVC